MTRKLTRPPEKHYGRYLVRNDSMGYLDKEGDYVPVVSGFVWVTAIVSDPVAREQSKLLRLEPLVGESRTVLVRAKEMRNGSLEEMLERNGIFVMKPTAVRDLIMQTAIAGDVTEKPPLMHVRRTGWFADRQGFYTGNQAILGGDLKTEDFFFESGPSAPFAMRGTLESWQENVGRHVVSNPYVFAMTLLGMASPFLQQAGQGSRIICLWGNKGTGKTLATQCAATVFGNGIDPAAGMYAEDPAYVTKFSATINGIEPMLAKYSPMPIVLDEMTEQDTSFMGELAYKVSSGEGKHRMTSSLRQAHPNRWQLIVLTTAERPLASCFASNGRPALGGMLDRAIDIPIGEGGVFSDFGDFDSFKALTRHLKAACGEHYGAPGKVLLEYVVNNPDAVAERFGELKEIEESLLPPGCGDGERRVVKCFAVAVAAGKIACDAGVFQCDEAEVMAAMQHLTDVWWHHRGGALQTIAEFVADNHERILEEPPTLAKRPKAFLAEVAAKDGKQATEALIIPENEFDIAFGREGNGLVRELATLNALIREQPNRNKHRFCNNKLFAYVVPFDRVYPYLEQVIEARENNTKTTDALEEMLD